MAKRPSAFAAPKELEESIGGQPPGAPGADKNPIGALPGAGPQQIGKTDNPDASDVPDLAKLKRYFTEARDLTQEARTNSLRTIDYYDGDHFTSDELAKLQARGQPPIVLNRIKPAINGMIGVTEKGRSDPKCWPRNPGEDDQADAATDVLRYISDYNRFKRTKQDCFWDMLVPGTMAALVGVDDDKQVTITQVRWEEFFHDPRARRKDLKDARYLGIAKWMYQDDVANLYPGNEASIEATVENGVGGGMAPDESYQDRPLGFSGSGGSPWVDVKQRRLMVVEMYYREGRWKRAVFTGSDILEGGDSPYLDHKGRPDCPIEAQSAYVKKDNARYGAVWDMIGPQDEVNKRRSKALNLLSVTRIEVKDPQAIDADANVARAEAARPDGVIPFGWGLSPNTAEFQGNMEMLQEAKSEIDRMGPSPAILGRGGEDSSGRALLARQQSGLVELANLYGGLEDWELRIYRQCWSRTKQFWTEPQFIRVTDDENVAKFVGLNQPIPGGPPTVGVDPQSGMPTLQPGILGYKNVVGEMDVDIEIDSQPDTGTIQQEAFNEIVHLVGGSPIYQQQISLKQLIQLSPIPHKRSVLDAIDQNAQQQQQENAQRQALAQQSEQAKIQETTSKAGLHQATGFAHALNALSEAHATHNDAAIGPLEMGLKSVQQPAQAPAVDPNAQAALQAQAAAQAQPQPQDPGQDGQ